MLKRFTAIPVFKNKAIHLNSQVMRGVHGVLREGFYPSYRYKEAAGPRTKPVRLATPRGNHKPRAVGQWVDTAVTYLVRYVRKYGWDSVARNTLSDAQQTHGYKRWNQSDRQQIEPVIKYLLEHDLEPYESQLTVANAELRVGTRVDLLARHTKEHYLVPIEIKCGFQDYLWQGSGHKMQYPFTVLPSDAPGFQHMLQVFLTAHLTDYTYKYLLKEPDKVVRIEECRVLVVHRDHDHPVRELKPFEMYPHVFNNCWDGMYAEMIRTKSQTKRQRTKSWTKKWRATKKHKAA